MQPLCSRRIHPQQSRSKMYVFFSDVCDCISVATNEESIPPERKQPIGTSETMQCLTEFVNASSSFFDFRHCRFPADFAYLFLRLSSQTNIFPVVV